MKKHRVPHSVVIAAFALFLLSGTVIAGQGDIENVHERMRLEIGLEDEGWRSLEPEVREHLDRGRRGDDVADLVRDLHGDGCRGLCLSEALRAYNDSRNRGLSGEETGLMIRHELREQHREREHGGHSWDDFETGRRLRIRVDDRLRIRFGDDSYDGDRHRGGGRDHVEDEPHRSGDDSRDDGHRRGGDDDSGSGGKSQGKGGKGRH